MKIEKLFQVLVVAGASTTVGLPACGNSGGGGGGGSSSSSSGGSSGSASSSSGSSGGGDGGMCSAVCHPETQIPSWIDCNGCCCWLPVGGTCGGTTPICGNEPCCSVNGNGR